MEFNARMARDMADCYKEHYHESNLIFPALYCNARKGLYNYSTTSDPFGKLSYKDAVECQDKLRELGFKVEIDEDMKTAYITW